MTLLAEKPPKAQVTIKDLYREPGKAEIVNGEVVRFTATGGVPGYAGNEIFSSLRTYAKERRTGRAVGDNKGFHVSLRNRTSFSPDAAYYTGPNPGMRFFEGAPIFAVEVRSENDYGVVAEREMATKHRDYFDAGTLVVWDVDLQNEIVVRKYSADVPDAPTLFRRGDIAEAEPAVPGWTMSVDDLFNEEDIDSIASSD